MINMKGRAARCVLLIQCALSRPYLHLEWRQAKAMQWLEMEHKKVLSGVAKKEGSCVVLPLDLEVWQKHAGNTELVAQLIK